MINFIESSAGRIASRIQSIGHYFDPEVLSLPGGSVIAALLWLYASTALSIKRATLRRATPIAACTGCFGHD